MRKLFGLAVLFLSFVGVSVAQHGAHAGAAPHYSAPAPHYSPTPHNNVQPYRGFQGGRPAYHGQYHGDFRRGGFGGWYGGRPEYRRFGWIHYRGWYPRYYGYVGPGYCYTGVWGAPFFTFGFNATRWRVVDFDFAIVSGWYPNSCAYVMVDPYHDGWYLLYDSQTGEYVHVEQY